MFKKILLIDNFDSFTFNLVDYFRQLECKVEIYRNDIDPTLLTGDIADLLVISPGPSIPQNAGNLMKIIDKFHDKLPIFGVCLGHEALIEYFGGSLKFIEPEHGKFSEIFHDGRTIYKGVDQAFYGGRYHSLIADIVPDCFEITARHEDLVMSVRHKNLPIESVQFHPESVLTMKGKNGFKIIENIVNKNFANVK